MVTQTQRNISRIMKEVEKYKTALGKITLSSQTEYIEICLGEHKTRIDPYIAELKEMEELIYLIIEKLVTTEAIHQIERKQDNE